MAEPLQRSTIDSKRLLYFYHVARNGSFSRAEAALKAPQPMISRYIQKLEDELGVQLLDRNGRGVTLTRFGEILYRRAELILRDMEDTISEIGVAKRSPTGVVRIAAPATVMSLYMPEVVRRFRRDQPDAELVAIQALTGEIYERLAAGKVDLGLVQEVLNPVKFDAQELLVEPMLGVVGNGHPLAARSSITRKQMVRHVTVLPSQTHGLRELIDKYLAEEDLSAEAPIQVDSVPLIREIVGMNEHLTIMPQSTCMLEFEQDRFTFLTLKPALTRTLFVAHSHDFGGNEQAAILLGHLTDVVNERVSSAKAAA